MTRAYQLAELEWDDCVGFIRRTLPIDRFCTQCGSMNFKRLDTHKRCTHPDYVPVQCLSCVPNEATWRAHPKKKWSDEAVEPRRTLRARVKDAYCGLVAGWRGP